MSRGTAEMISAVLWFSDLRGYTSISESASPDQILPLLNDYAEAVISAVHGCGGDVLKLIGDGTLAIFKGGDSAEACRSALRAEADLRNKIEALNARRQEQNQPVTSVYLGLHIGDVFYGNIGSRERLDFTVIGPAVNEVGRIASMCRSVDRHVLLSSSFVETLPHEERSRFVSVGRYALRGSNRPQELFTLDPERLN
jgi:adenylate cyclase